MGWACSKYGRDESLVGKREVIGIDMRIILKPVLNKLVGRVWTGWIWLMLGIHGGLM
jgi:hypothetical protein